MLQPPNLRATLAANEVFRLPLPHKTVLLMGSSGQMGGIILKNLSSSPITMDSIPQTTRKRCCSAFRP